MLADDLIEKVRRVARIPNAEPTYTDEVILEIADEEIRKVLVPYIEKRKQNYFLQHVDLVIPGGQPYFTIPSRAVVAGFRSMGYVRGTSYIALEAVAHERFYYDVADVTRGGDPLWFTLESGRVRIAPVPIQSMTLRLFYNMAPAHLVVEADVGVVDSVTSSTVVEITAAGTLPASPATFRCDVVSPGSPFTPLATDVEVSRSDTTFTFTVPVEGLVEGAYLCFPGTAPGVQIPEESALVLVDCVSARILLELGFVQEGQILFSLYQGALSEQKTTLANRNAGKKEVVAPQNNLFARTGRGGLGPRRGTRR